MENLQRGRDRLRVKVVESVESKARRKLEDRFDKLVAMFERVKMPEPEVQEKGESKKSRCKGART